MSLVQSEYLSEPHPPRLSYCYPAVAASVPIGRNAVVAFAAMAGADEELIDAVRLAASEALTNVVLHAYDGDPGRIHVAAWLAADELWLLIADDGYGLRPNPDGPGMGLGLGIIVQLSDSCSIVKRSSGGTELRIRFRLGAGGDGCRRQDRGSRATRPASLTFSTTR
jgi:anti-sigma regulatory factor (Ser/Thr protein kinase)